MQDDTVRALGWLAGLAALIGFLARAMVLAGVNVGPLGELNAVKYVDVVRFVAM